MATYYKHTKIDSVKLPYSFRCEQCMQDSGLLETTIAGNEATVNTNSRVLSEKKARQLDRLAHQKLVIAVKTAYTEVTEKGIYPQFIGDKCPHCGRPQSWALTGMKDDLYINSIASLIIGVIVALACFIFLEADSFRTTVIIGVMAVAVARAVGCYLFNKAKIAGKEKKTSGALEKNKPEIYWDAVQYLLDEK